jgi:Secretion system C-terminal sorting domain
MDMDGRFNYSDIVAIKVNSSNKDIIIFPNPVQNELHIQVASVSKENALLQVQDITGKVLQQQPIGLNNALTAVSMNVTDLQKGIYMLVLQLEGEKITRKFIKN